ncbi:hypothetical protein D3C78_1361680 [compost metagenome]
MKELFEQRVAEKKNTKELLRLLSFVQGELDRVRAGEARPTELAPTPPSNGLTFPYVTQQLEAMRTAVAKYWEGYTPDKRQPTQKAIGHTLGELLGLPPQRNGEPARKAMSLAAVIKPDTLPDV